MADMGLVVVGAGGRMGRMLVKTISETEGCTLAGAIEQPGSIASGEDAGLLAGAGRANVAITDDPDAAFAHADGRARFHRARARASALPKLAAKTGIVHVVGTTGLEEAISPSCARPRRVLASSSPATCRSGSTSSPRSSRRSRRRSARSSTSRSSRCITG